MLQVSDAGAVKWGGDGDLKWSVHGVHKLVVHAFLDGRGFVEPEDVKQMALDTLRHRVLLSYEAEAEGITVDTVLEQILRQVPTP